MGLMDTIGSLFGGGVPSRPLAQPPVVSQPAQRSVIDQAGNTISVPFAAPDSRPAATALAAPQPAQHSPAAPDVNARLTALEKAVATISGLLEPLMAMLGLAQQPVDQAAAPTQQAPATIPFPTQPQAAAPVQAQLAQAA